MPHDVGVLTVDDQESFREVARDLVEQTPGFAPVGEADSGASALAALEDLDPRLVLLDVRMPRMDGIETARRIHAGHPDVVVVLVSAEEVDTLPPEARTCGAVECIRKEELCPRRLRRLWAAHGARA